MNINTVLRFTRTREETPIIIVKVKRQLWAGSAPYWYVPMERISALEKIGLNPGILGRYILCGTAIEFDTYLRPDFSKLISIADYPVEMIKTSGERPAFTYFNNGEYRAPSRYVSFITGNRDDLTFRYNPQRKRIAAFDDSNCLGACIAGKVNPPLELNDCIVCGNAARWAYSANGRKYPVCGEEHEKSAIGKERAVEFLDSLWME
jgi:hypothetical protein